MEKEIPQLFINGEYAVAVCDIDQFKGHRGSKLHGIEIPTGGAEAAVTPEGDEFEFSTAVYSKIKVPQIGK